MYIDNVKSLAEHVAKYPTYPDVKPSDNWASAPRLDFWMDGLVRGNNDYVVFDFYMDPVRATTGAISITGVFQPPSAGYWAQIPVSFTIERKRQTVV